MRAHTASRFVPRSLPGSYSKSSVSSAAPQLPTSPCGRGGTTGGLLQVRCLTFIIVPFKVNGLGFRFHHVLSSLPPPPPQINCSLLTSNFPRTHWTCTPPLPPVRLQTAALSELTPPWCPTSESHVPTTTLLVGLQVNVFMFRGRLNHFNLFLNSFTGF